MTKLVAQGATMKCNQGTSTATLGIARAGIDSDTAPLATVDDYKPMVNIGSFGNCKTQANPSVASATSAAQGVLTPMPCIPVTTSAWSPGSSIVDVDGVKALTKNSTCSCSYTGTIEITDPASTIETD